MNTKTHNYPLLNHTLNYISTPSRKRNGGIPIAKISVSAPDLGGVVDRIRVRVQKSLSTSTQLREDCPTPAAWTDVSIRQEPPIDHHVSSASDSAGYDQPVVLASHLVNFSPPHDTEI